MGETNYGEPWRSNESGHIVVGVSNYVAEAYEAELAQRICLCVNACAGIPDADLAGLKVGKLLEYLERHANWDPNHLTEWGKASHDLAKRALAIARGGNP